MLTALSIPLILGLAAWLLPAPGQIQAYRLMYGRQVASEIEPVFDTHGSEVFSPKESSENETNTFWQQPGKARVSLRIELEGDADTELEGNETGSANDDEPQQVSENGDNPN